MNRKTLMEVRESMVKAELTIMEGKGHDYSGGEDRLANFKRIAERASLTPGQVWLVYFLKHVDAVCTHVQSGLKGKEGILSRLHDIRNYALLLAALEQEKGEEEGDGKSIREFECVLCGKTTQVPQKSPRYRIRRCSRCHYERGGMDK